MAELDEFQKLEQALIDAGRAIEYPPTPNLAARVRTDSTANCPRSAARSASRRAGVDRGPGHSGCHRPAADHSRNARSHRAAVRPTHHTPYRGYTHPAAVGNATPHLHTGRRALQTMLRINLSRSAAAGATSNCCCRQTSNRHGSSFKITFLGEAVRRSRWCWSLAIRIDHASYCIRRCVPLWENVIRATVAP